MKVKSGPYETTKTSNLFIGNLRALIRPKLVLAFLILGVFACTTLPKPEHKKFSFPKEKAFIKQPKRAFISLGRVRSRVDFSTMDIDRSIEGLCRNYFNRAVQQLVEIAEKKGADAVIEVRSVVFHMDGSKKSFDRPECVDTGAEGQVLAQGMAVKWKK